MQTHLNSGENNSAKKSVLVCTRGENNCKSLTQSSTWLETKAFPFTLVKGLLEVERAVRGEKHSETAERATALAQPVSTKLPVSLTLNTCSAAELL